ncbi:MAG: DUF2946 domain-containing protein [Gammaproteobacteria bacterium]
MGALHNPGVASALRFRICAWLSVAAMLFASIAPAVAHAGRSSTAPGDVLHEICTSFGVKRVALDVDRSSPSGGGDHRSADCPFCLLHMAVGPPPALIAILAPAPLDQAVWVLLDSPHPPGNRAAHRPRGPPRAS